MWRLSKRQVALTSILVMLALVCAPGVLAATQPPGIPPAPPSKSLQQQAAAQARAEGRAGAEARTTRAGSAAWEQAIQQAEQPQLRDVLEPRPLAAILGSAWFLLVLRHRWRSRPVARQGS